MSLVDRAIRTLAVVTFLACFVAPVRWIFPLVLFCFGAIGVWAFLYPERVLGWARAVRHDPDENDSSIRWIRLIGACFLLFVVVLALASHGRWR